MTDEKTPMVIGREAGDERHNQMYNNQHDERSATKLVATQELQFFQPESSSCPFFTVELFESLNTGDRGGYVLRLRLSDTHGSDFIPHAKLIRDGVEVHVAGQAEGDAFVEVLRRLFAGINQISLDREEGPCDDDTCEIPDESVSPRSEGAI